MLNIKIPDRSMEIKNVRKKYISTHNSSTCGIFNKGYFLKKIENQWHYIKGNNQKYSK